MTPLTRNSFVFSSLHFVFLAFICYGIVACDNNNARPASKPPDNVVVKKPEQVNEKASELVEKMIAARKVCNGIDNTRTKAIAYQSQVKDTFFDAIRYNVDKLELLVDDKEWYLPKYREMLFLR